jgi:DNA-binding transcriptional LysR family regulator
MNELIDDQLLDFALLVRIVDFGGFSAAARATGIPQATISRRIARLEKTSGVRLLDRTTRTVKLSQAGLRVYEHARLMLDQGEAAGTVIRSLTAEPSGHLRIIAPVILGESFVGDIVAQFASVYPAVSTKLELSSRNIDLIEEGFDIAIRIGSNPDSSLVQTPLGKAFTALYASPEYLRDSEPILSPQDLVHHPILAIGLSLKETSLTLTHNAVTEEIPIHCRIVSNHTQPLVSGARQGLGLAVLPNFVGEIDVKDGKLVRVLPQHAMPGVSISALTPTRRGALPAVSTFVRFVKDHLDRLLTAPQVS